MYKRQTLIPEASETIHDTFCGAQSNYSGCNVGQGRYAERKLEFSQTAMHSFI